MSSSNAAKPLCFRGCTDQCNDTGKRVSALGECPHHDTTLFTQGFRWLHAFAQQPGAPVEAHLACKGWQAVSAELLRVSSLSTTEITSSMKGETLRTHGQTKDCKGCRYWSETIAMARGGEVQALCLARGRGASMAGHYTGRSQTCSAWASGHLGPVDEPGNDAANKYALTRDS